MAPARTRSVMLLADALEHDWLVPQGAPIRVLDALCSTGVRIRRWRQELPEAHIERVVLTGNDLDAHALDWAMATFEAHPSGRSPATRPEHRQRAVKPREVEGVHFTQEDARVALLRVARVRRAGTVEKGQGYGGRLQRGRQAGAKSSGRYSKCSVS